MLTAPLSLVRRPATALALAVLLGAFVAPTSSVAQQELPPMSLNAVVDTASAQNTPILVEIYAPWCPWCQRMQKQVYGSTPVKSYLDEHFTYARLNGDTEEGAHQLGGRTLNSSQLASALGARGFPTTVFLRPDGTPIGTLPGFIDRSTFLQVLQYVGSNAYQKQSFQKFMSSQAK